MPKTLSRRQWTVLGLGVLAGVAVAGTLVWQDAIQPVGGQSPIRIVIAPGSSVRQVGQQLQEAGVIRRRWAWSLWSRLFPWVVAAGTYDLDPTETLPSVIAQLQRGETVQVRITIPEGWSIRQMDAYLRENHGIDNFQALAEEVRNVALPEWLPQEAPSLEGYLFPETYQLPIESVTAQALIERMLAQFARQALPLWQAHTPPPQVTLHEWVTLASIVEKEAVLASERTLIAGVFWKRLALGIPLGADPTVEYALNIRQTPERRLTFADIRTPSPYNTYLNVGLPPGAIASPGLASLQATLTPSDTEYLYFVARYDGSHVFSKTLAEHEAAQRTIIRQQQSGS
ncbi:MAG: endolytic transglycosylase MltG [Synechococcales cyanobacterium]